VSEAGEAERSFEDLLRELEEVVGALERGDVSVDEAIALWRRGEELHRLCAARLEVAEGHIEELGAPQLSPRAAPGGDTGPSGL